MVLSFLLNVFIIRKTNIKEKEYTLQKTNPFYAISNKNNGDYAVIILQKSSNNYFYYIDSNNDNKTI